LDTYPFFVERLKNSCRRKSLTCPRRNNVVHMAYVESAVGSGGDREPVPAMVCLRPSSSSSSLGWSVQRKCQAEYQDLSRRASSAWMAYTVGIYAGEEVLIAGRRSSRCKRQA